MLASASVILTPAENRFLHSMQRAGRAASPRDSAAIRALMRWLMIGLLVSVAGLLVAALGMARHIWARRSNSPVPGAQTATQIEMADEGESEMER